MVSGASPGNTNSLLPLTVTPSLRSRGQLYTSMKVQGLSASLKIVTRHTLTEVGSESMLGQHIKVESIHVRIVIRRLQQKEV